MLEEGLIVELRARALERRRRYHLTLQGRAALKAEIARMTEMLKQARTHGLLPKRA